MVTPPLVPADAGFRLVRVGGECTLGLLPLELVKTPRNNYKQLIFRKTIRITVRNSHLNYKSAAGLSPDKEQSCIGRIVVVESSVRRKDPGANRKATGIDIGYVGHLFEPFEAAGRDNWS